MAENQDDAAVAQELREEIAKPIAEACRILDRARSAGLNMSFTINADAIGLHRAVIFIQKPL